MRTRTSTGGGQIVLGGGADANSDSIPDGSAYAADNTVSDCGIESGRGSSASSVTSYFSGGGSISIKGASGGTGGDGLCFDNGTFMYANSGTISLTGASTSGLGLQLSRNPSTTSTSERYPKS